VCGASWRWPDAGPVDPWPGLRREPQRLEQQPREKLGNLHRISPDDEDQQRISMEQLPTLADLRVRRMELTRAGLRESILDEDLERFRAVIEPLTEEFDLMEVALAAAKLAHESSGASADEEEEIPQVAPQAGRERERREGRRAERRVRGPSDGMTRLFVGVGRSSGIRPQDLVGATAGESPLNGRDIGASEIADRFSLVEVPQSAADEVITSLRHSTIKGRKATVRRERHHPAGGSS
jgi:ATP-dependent RNA helicase DeaD